jgi:hypothetical protein
MKEVGVGEDIASWKYCKKVLESQAMCERNDKGSDDGNNYNNYIGRCRHASWSGLCHLEKASTSLIDIQQEIPESHPT